MTALIIIAVYIAGIGAAYHLTLAYPEHFEGEHASAVQILFSFLWFMLVPWSLGFFVFGNLRWIKYKITGKLPKDWE